MHPWLILGILIPELPFSGKHEVYQQNAYDINKNNLDGFPEPGDAFGPVHGVNLKYLLQLLTSPLYFCSKARKLYFLLENEIMTKGSTFQGYIPIMLEPDDSSPMVSQLLFGEEFTLIEKSGEWLSVSLDFDDCSGWVRNQGVELREVENGKEKQHGKAVCLASLPSTTILDLTLGQRRIIPAGAVWNSERGHPMQRHAHSFER